MKIRPYLTFNGACADAIDLYKRAFQTDVLQIMRFSDLPPQPEFQIPDVYKSRIIQATLKMGDDFIRLSDCGPGHELNDQDTEKLSIAVDASVAIVRQAFTILAEEGTVGIPLAEKFYSPCAGVVFDKFGVMWNLVGQKDEW